jgi:methyltransferase (TIGR00027 family)
MQSAPNLPLASTARWTAAARAHESARPDRLFNDPWAAALAGEEGAAWMAQRTPDKILPMVIRTRFFDDYLARVTAENSIRQVVLMAAGLDTRAYRLAWPAGTRLFELDQPAVLAHKDAVLKAAGAAPACERQAIGLDLTGAWQPALETAGFIPAAPSLWLLEGFLFYLPDASLEQVLAGVCAYAAPGSALGFDIINHLTLTHPLTQAWIAMQAQAGAPWTGALDDPETFLAQRGWQPALTQIGLPDAIYGRSFPAIPARMPGIPHNWYVTARKGS